MHYDDDDYDEIILNTNLDIYLCDYIEGTPNSISKRVKMSQIENRPFELCVSF